MKPRFGDRFRCASDAERQWRWKRYWEHLARLKIRGRGPIYRLFAGEVFHDGGIGVSLAEISKRIIELELENIHAINGVIELRKKTNAPGVTIDRADFGTRIRFYGVKHFEMRLSPAAERFYYHSAELERHGGSLVLTVFAREGLEPPSLLAVVFSSMEAEDITARLAKYLPPGVRPSKILSFIGRRAPRPIRAKTRRA